MSFSLKSLVSKAPGEGQFLKKVADMVPSGKKFELVDDDTVVVDGVTLYRVRAVRDFGGTRRGRRVVVKRGELGGYVASEDCLSQDGLAWVYSDAKIVDGYVGGSSSLFGRAVLKGGGRLVHDVELRDDVMVDGQVVLNGVITLRDRVKMLGTIRVSGIDVTFRDDVVASGSADFTVNNGVFAGKCEFGGYVHLVGQNFQMLGAVKFLHHANIEFPDGGVFLGVTGKVWDEAPEGVEQDTHFFQFSSRVGTSLIAKDEETRHYANLPIVAGLHRYSTAGSGDDYVFWTDAELAETDYLKDTTPKAADK